MMFESDRAARAEARDSHPMQNGISDPASRLLRAARHRSGPSHRSVVDCRQQEDLCVRYLGICWRFAATRTVRSLVSIV